MSVTYNDSVNGTTATAIAGVASPTGISEYGGNTLISDLPGDREEIVEYKHNHIDISSAGRLTLKFIRESDGRITVLCPEIELAAFGKDEDDAWQNFLSMFKDTIDFYFEEKHRLSEELKKRYSVFENEYISFRRVHR